MDDTAAAPQRELLTLVTARVRDAVVRRPFYVDGGDDLVTVCRKLAERGLTFALVRDVDAARGERLGIFTTTDLRDALLRETPPQATPVRAVARFDLVEVQAEAELFEALWLMVQHRVHRLVVRDGDMVAGVLGQLDLVSFVANHSHLVALQIDEAATPGELAPAAARIDELVRVLHASGLRVERIARLASEMNRRLIAKLWSLVAPPALVRDSCLLVMGSEGRGEQVLRTDQDNALLLRDGVVFDDLEGVTARFGDALQALGWPPCPGGIMVRHAAWRQPLAAFKDTLRGWVHDGGPGADPEGPMKLAIFFDAAAVAGDATLLEAARAHLDALLGGQDPWLARFAAAADQFEEPGNWLTRLTARRDVQPLDLKKLGIFPLVHGVRALALQHRVRAAGTAARLAALVAAGRLEAPFARDLEDALHLLMRVRLTHQLAQRARGEPVSNTVRPADLGTLEREPLHDALAIVKRFRAFLRQHFRLDTL